MRANESDAHFHQPSSTGRLAFSLDELMSEIHWLLSFLSFMGLEEVFVQSPGSLFKRKEFFLCLYFFCLQVSYCPPGLIRIHEQ
uniref:Uncharacterized protein n=1 Tax=Ficedula albicollis TaxID=59894 RepID=A0A803VCF8_FICAL